MTFPYFRYFQYNITDGGIKGRRLIRFNNCFTVVNKEDKRKALHFSFFAHISFLGLIHCLSDISDGLHVRYVADLGN